MLCFLMHKRLLVVSENNTIQTIFSWATKQNKLATPNLLRAAHLEKKTQREDFRKEFEISELRVLHLLRIFPTFLWIGSKIFWFWPASQPASRPHCQVAFFTPFLEVSSGMETGTGDVGWTGQTGTGGEGSVPVNTRCRPLAGLWVGRRSMCSEAQLR